MEQGIEKRMEEMRGVEEDVRVERRKAEKYEEIDWYKGDGRAGGDKK